MSLKIYKDYTVSPQLETYLPSEAMAAGELVKLAAGASGVGLGKVTRAAGGQDNADLVYGVVQKTVTAAQVSAGETVEVLPIDPRQTWVCTAAANTNSNIIGTQAGIFLAAKGTAGDAGAYALTTGGTITVNGALVYVVGVLGAASARTYLVKFYSAHLLGGVTFTT